MHTKPNCLAQKLEADLFASYGPLLGEDNLRRVLGYPSGEALRQAIARKKLPIPFFSIKHRRGKFALVTDVAVWLANLRNQAVTPEEEGP